MRNTAPKKVVVSIAFEIMILILGFQFFNDSFYVTLKLFSSLQQITFGVNETTKIVKIKIVHEGEKSLRRAFSLYIKPDTNRVAELGLKKTIVYIEEVGRRTGVTFPLKPKVVSLQDYDNLRRARRSPIQGYPLICVTVCCLHSFMLGSIPI